MQLYKCMELLGSARVKMKLLSCPLLTFIKQLWIWAAGGEGGIWPSALEGIVTLLIQARDSTN